jgi:hypothetical protein
VGFCHKIRRSNPTRKVSGVPSRNLSGCGLTDSFADSPVRRIESMSIVVWKVIRRRPKPLLLVMLFFLMAVVCLA